MFENKWEPDYGNASHPGLLSDSTQSPSSEFLTIQRKDFVWPKHNKGPCARRKQLLQRSLFNEILEDYERKITSEDKGNKFEEFSTYLASYKGDGFDVRDILESADSEKMAKYPLYSDQAFSIYFDKIKNIKQKRVSNDPQACFRKYSYFSKPFYAELE